MVDELPISPLDREPESKKAVEHPGARKREFQELQFFESRIAMFGELVAKMENEDDFRV